MQLHEAIVEARKELGMSQQKLADLAGIERKQLSILENGGSVTLRTIRKVLAHLPNIQTFTIGEASGTVALALSPESQAEIARAAAKALGTVLQKVFMPLTRGRLPTAEDGGLIDEANRELYRSMGYSDEEYEQLRAGVEKNQPPERPMTEEEMAKASAELDAAIDQTKEAFAQMAREEEAEAAEREKDKDKKPPPAE